MLALLNRPLFSLGRSGLMLPPIPNKVMQSEGFVLLDEAGNPVYDQANKTVTDLDSSTHKVTDQKGGIYLDEAGNPIYDMGKPTVQDLAGGEMLDENGDSILNEGSNDA